MSTNILGERLERLSTQMLFASVNASLGLYRIGKKEALSQERHKIKAVSEFLDEALKGFENAENSQHGKEYAVSSISEALKYDGAYQHIAPILTESPKSKELLLETRDFFKKILQEQKEQEVEKDEIEKFIRFLSKIISHFELENWRESNRIGRVWPI